MEKKRNAPVKKAYTKEQLTASQKWKHSRDVLEAILKPGELYTPEEVEQALETFRKGRF